MFDQEVDGGLPLTGAGAARRATAQPEPWLPGLLPTPPIPPRAGRNGGTTQPRGPRQTGRQAFGNAAEDRCPLLAFGLALGTICFRAPASKTRGWFAA